MLSRPARIALAEKSIGSTSQNYTHVRFVVNVSASDYPKLRERKPSLQLPGSLLVTIFQRDFFHCAYGVVERFCWQPRV
jgi:hypothetical protein